jgi:WD40 repeat protein
VTLFAVADGRLLRELSPAPVDTVLAAKFSPDGSTLAVAGADRMVTLWDVASGQPKQSLAGHTAHVLGLSWKADGKVLASSSTDRTIKFWNVEQGALQQTLKGDTYQIGPYKGEISSLTFVGASEQLLAASGDGTVRLHRTTSENDILTFGGSQGYQNCVAATPDGQMLVAGGADGKLRIWSRHERDVKATIEP